ncbi:LPXTG cell wall anchor domain-containing protein [Patulibacter defluvii]|uniref:LPXTG cell wall anchor domain-containing protein n=1 Tax=Patulibacter defluvii TaxID=3095358 RepID=UPI002A749FEA|nr:LPXTG cell wall anchor domain-containing protein [Patulibacter sp. DM4]
MRPERRALSAVLAAGVVTLAVVASNPSVAAAQSEPFGRLLDQPPDLRPAPARREPPARPDREPGARSPRAAAAAHLPDTGSDLRGLALVGLAMALAGAGLRLRTADVRW